jgi:HEAT repeat protein
MPAGSNPKAIARSAMRWQEWWLRNRDFLIRVNRRKLATSGGEIASGKTAPVTEKLVAFLVKGMTDKYWDVRAASAIALGKAGVKNRVVIAALEKATRDEKPSVQESAVLALGMLRARSSAFLLRRVLMNKQNDRNLRATAAVSLGLLGDSANVKTLCTFTQNGQKDEVKAAAVTGLGLIDDPGSAHTLLRLITGHEEAEIRALAVTSLGKLGVRSLRFRGQREESNLIRYIEKLMRRERKAVIRQSCAMILGRIGDESTLEKLMKAAVTDRDAAVRSFALLSLATVKKSREKSAAVWMFLRKRLAEEKENPVRCYAAIAIGLAGDRRGGELLRKSFTDGSSADLRAAAAVGLGILKDNESLPLLGKEIQEPRSGGDVRRFSCIAIGLIGKMHAAEYLRAVLRESNQPYLRWSAAIGLARLGDRSCQSILVGNLGENSRITREAAIRALGYFRDETHVRTLMDHFKTEKDNELRAMCIVSLGYIGDASEEIPVLRHVSRDFNWLASLRYAAIDFIVRAF